MIESYMSRFFIKLILKKMDSIIDKPRSKPKDNAPKIQKIQIDKSKIKEKLIENKSSLEKEKNTIDKNLSNENFVSKAPKDLIDQNKERQSSINMELSKIDSILINIQ